MINVKKLVCNPLFNSGSVIRYGGIHMVEQETLSNHLYETGILALMMIKELEGLGIEIDKGKMLERALVHDIPETVTLDFPRPIKYSDMRIKNALDELEIKVCSHIETLVQIPGLLSEVEICKDDTREGHLLKLVDLMLVARKCIREVSLKSNKEFVIVLKEVHEYIIKTYEYYIGCEERLNEKFGKEFIEYLLANYNSNLEDLYDTITKNPIDEELMLRRKDIF